MEEEGGALCATVGRPQCLPVKRRYSNRVTSALVFAPSAGRRHFEKINTPSQANRHNQQLPALCQAGNRCQRTLHSSKHYNTLSSVRDLKTYIQPNRCAPFTSLYSSTHDSAHRVLIHPIYEQACSCASIRKTPCSTFASLFPAVSSGRPPPITRRTQSAPFHLVVDNAVSC